jgi:hypothetical protein
MTLQRAVIECRTKFWEHGQLYVALSRVKSPANLCSLLPDDMADFIIHPCVNLDVVQIPEKMQSSRLLPIPQMSPGDNVESDVASIDRSDAALSKEFPCSDDSFDFAEGQIDFVPRLDEDAVEIFDPYSDEISLNIQIMSRIFEDQHVLRFNCLGDIVPQIHISRSPMPAATLLHRRLQTCCAEFVSVINEQLPLRLKGQFMNSLFEVRILLSRFLVIYRVYRQCRFPRSSQSQTIDDVIGPGLIDPCVKLFLGHCSFHRLDWHSERGFAKPRRPSQFFSRN